MDAAIPVKTASGDKNMSRQAALYQRLWEMAAKGNLQAAKFLLDRYAEAQSRRAGKNAEQADLSADELGMLESFMAGLQLNSIEAVSKEAQS